MRAFEAIVISLLAAGVILGEVLASKMTTPAVQAALSSDQLREQTVHVLAFKGDSPDGSGSGVLFKEVKSGRTYVFTAAHVIPDSCDQRMVVEIHSLVATTPLHQIDAEIVWVDRRRDFALLLVTSSHQFNIYARASAQRPGIGHLVQHIGFMGGHDMPHAYASGPVFFLDSRTCKWLDIPCDAARMMAIPGSSGGGVFDSDGRYVGVLVGSSTFGAAFYVPLGGINASLEEARLGLVF